MKILVVNSGSSSIKYQVFAMPEAQVLAKGLVERIGEEGSKLKHSAGEKKTECECKIADHSEGLKMIIEHITNDEYGVVKDIHEIGAVGHRVVHGGEAHADSTLIDEGVVKTIDENADLAPLHNPPNLMGIKATMEILGDKTPQVAVFDTAFHQSMPQKAFLYGLPYKYYSEQKVRRYGFHGTSHRYVANEAVSFLDKPKEEANLITCHLGNGGSICAVKGGKSVDTSMGLTPLEGLVMGTRSGDIDPAIIFYIQDRLGLSNDEMNKVLNKKSGLLGISEMSNDMRTLAEEAEKGSDKAQLAIDVFSYRIRKYVGSYMTALSKLDAIVFTGGIGENNADVRRAVCEDLDFWGIELDSEKNESLNRKGGVISKDSSKVKIIIIPTDEEKAIALDTYKLSSK